MVLFLVAKCKTASNNSSQDIQSFWRFQIILKKIHSGLARMSWSKGGSQNNFRRDSLFLGSPRSLEDGKGMANLYSCGPARDLRSSVFLVFLSDLLFSANWNAILYRKVRDIFFSVKESMYLENKNGGGRHLVPLRPDMIILSVVIKKSDNMNPYWKEKGSFETI